MPIHPSAVVDPRAVVHPTATVGPCAVIDGPARIGPGCILGPAAVVLGHTDVGAGCQIHSHAVIGGEPQDRKFGGAVSYTRLGPECIVREGATVHRGTAPGSITTVGARCLLMTNTHVGHNCTLADDVILVSGALLGGHVEIGPRAMISGNAAIHQFVRVGGRQQELLATRRLGTANTTKRPTADSRRHGQSARSAQQRNFVEAWPLHAARAESGERVATPRRESPTMKFSRRRPAGVDTAPARYSIAALRPRPVR